MPTMQVSIFQTNDLTSYCNSNFGEPFRAAKRVKTWTQGVFNNTKNYDVSITIGDKTPDPLIEECQKSFTQCCLCTCDNQIDEDCTYNHLWDYWTDWTDQADCKDPHVFEKDANLLLSNERNGVGLGGGQHATACVGRDCADLSSTYSRFGYQPRHESLQVVFEEIGHCFINKSKANCSKYNEDDNAGSHDYGVIKYDSNNDDYAVTPLRVSGDTCHNNCSNTTYDTEFCKSKADDDGDGIADGWAFMYSDCAQCNFYKK